MYYQNYEDYIRSILGYPVSTSNNTYQSNTYNYSNYNHEPMANNIPRYNSEILELYPEIYKIVNPMVCKICEANSKPITRELIEQMTDEIYLNIECDNSEEDAVNVRVTLPPKASSENKRKDSSKEVRTTNTNSSPNIAKSSNNVNSRSSQNQVRQEEKSSDIPQNRQFRRNNTLRDLIKILILNQLLGINRPPHRPEMPRPPYPVRPPQNLRPPMNPRDMYGF